VGVCLVGEVGYPLSSAAGGAPSFPRSAGALLLLKSAIVARQDDDLGTSFGSGRV